MLSFTTLPTRFFVLPNSDLSSQFKIFEGKSRKKQRLMALHFVAVKETCSLLGSLDAKNRNYSDCFCSCGGFVRRCKKGWGSEGDFALEAEILEFMKNSEKPEAFPSKKQLIDAGKMDLMEAILKQGGWLASGWDLDDNVNEEEGVVCTADRGWDLITDKECNTAVVQEKVLEGSEERSSEDSSFRIAVGSYPPPSLAETAAENDSGIEGISSRLDKERNMNFGFCLKERTGSIHVKINNLNHNLLNKSAKNVAFAVVDSERNNGTASSNPNNDSINDSEGKLSHSTSLSNIDRLENSLKPNAWRTWSIRRAGFSEIKFEAAEFFICETRAGDEVDDLRDEILETREGATASSNSRKENSFHERIKYNQIQNRLLHWESELSSVLNSLKSNADENASEKVQENSSDDLQKLFDAWEFQENEIMTAQAKLRSIRAKLAVLEGKMALAIIEAQKVAEEKQRRVHDAQRALRLIRTACIVWPNSASEVFLAGSFDGWTAKRKMQKSSTGIYSLHLKLYPGKYQIKFIVDGEWRIDALRPIVHNDGYENNLLIIT